MKLVVACIMSIASIFSSKGQNVFGFDTMVNTMITKDVEIISRDSLQKLIDQDGIVLLDTREQDEYEVSHLKNARQVGYESFDINSIADISKESTIVVYCSVGYRSGLVGKQMVDAGYQNVYNLYGGIFDWTNHDLPVVDTKNKIVKQVHPYNSMWGFWVNKYEKRYEP